MSAPAAAHFGWFTVFRLGLVQACIGAMVVLTTSTLNRIMVVELALPALLPGLLVAVHYMVQMLRPRMGFGSDVGGRRTPWIIGGLAVLGLGAIGAAASVALIPVARVPGIVAAFVSFIVIGLGVGAAGTSLLVLLAQRVPEQRRAPAATIVWMMMILGLAVTAGVAGKLLDPYSPARLMTVMSGVAVLAFLLANVALYRVEGAGRRPAADSEAKPDFRQALAEVWADGDARRFTIFIFVSMLAFSAQDLILEPFAGTVFGFTPGESTSLSGMQHGGVLAGMILVALAGQRLGLLRAWSVGGCLASALCLASLVGAGIVGPGWPFKATVFLLGVANGAFSIAAVGSMMRLAGEGKPGREGVRMGLWGAAQAVAFGLGGVVGTGASDLAHWLLGESSVAYSSVFAAEALLFVVSAFLAAKIDARPRATATPRLFVEPAVAKVE